MRQVSTLFEPPALPVEDNEWNKLIITAPPASMFSRSSPKAVEDFGLTMAEIRLDSFHDDMLPTPEELKTLGLVPPTPWSRKRWFRLMCAGVLCAILAGVLLIVVRAAADNKGGNDDPIAENSLQADVPQITTRIHSAIDFLLKSVNHNQLTNSSSPEFRAARWMADEDRLRLPFTSSFLERYALASLWFATQGDKRWRNDLFMTEKHHCEWYLRLQAVDKTEFFGVRCNDRNEVINLVLRKLHQTYCTDHFRSMLLIL